MKKLLPILITCHLSLVTFPAPAVKLCRKNCWGHVLDISPAKWKTNDSLAGSYTNGTGYSDVAWSFTSTTSGATGTISGVARCTGSNTSSTASSSGAYCWCQVTGVTVGGTATTCSVAEGGPWVFNYYSNLSGSASGCQSSCANYCAGYCVRVGSSDSCSRAALFASQTLSIASAVTCPISGTCTNTDYKTIGDSDSCGSGWDETTGPTLTVSGTYSDTKGSFNYGACTK